MGGPPWASPTPRSAPRRSHGASRAAMTTGPRDATARRSDRAGPQWAGLWGVALPALGRAHPDLRNARRDQPGPWIALHAGRVRRARPHRADRELLARPAPGPAGRGAGGRGHRALVPPTALSPARAGPGAPHVRPHLPLRGPDQVDVRGQDSLDPGPGAPLGLDDCGGAHLSFLPDLRDRVRPRDGGRPVAARRADALGSIIRAGVYDAEMAAGVGININRLFTAVFAFGAALAGLSGVIAGPIQSAYPAMGVGILIPALIVVVIGGLGSLKGSLAGSLIIGQAETFGKAWLPEAAMLMIYVVMALVVLLRPHGLFGRPLR